MTNKRNEIEEIMKKIGLDMPTEEIKAEENIQYFFRKLNKKGKEITPSFKGYYHYFMQNCLPNRCKNSDKKYMAYFLWLLSLYLTPYILNENTQISQNDFYHKAFLLFSKLDTEKKCELQYARPISLAFLKKSVFQISTPPSQPIFYIDELLAFILYIKLLQVKYEKDTEKVQIFSNRRLQEAINKCQSQIFEIGMKLGKYTFDFTIADNKYFTPKPIKDIKGNTILDTADNSFLRYQALTGRLPNVQDQRTIRENCFRKYLLMFIEKKEPKNLEDKLTFDDMINYILLDSYSAITGKKQKRHILESHIEGKKFRSRLEILLRIVENNLKEKGDGSAWESFILLLQLEEHRKDLLTFQNFSFKLGPKKCHNMLELLDLCEFYPPESLIGLFLWNFLSNFYDSYHQGEILANEFYVTKLVSSKEEKN